MKLRGVKNINLLGGWDFLVEKWKVDSWKLKYKRLKKIKKKSF